MVNYRRVRSVAGFIIGIFIRMTFSLSIFGEKITRFDNMVYYILKLVIDIFMKLINEGLLTIPISHSQVSFVKYSHSYFVEKISIQVYMWWKI